MIWSNALKQAHEQMLTLQCWEHPKAEKRLDAPLFRSNPALLIL